MPEKLSEDDLSPLAAEYVLGTLEADERTRAGVLLDVDPKFRDTVRVWERRLGELHLMVEPVVPEPRIWERIRGKLGHAAAERVITSVEELEEPETESIPEADPLPPPPPLPKVDGPEAEATTEQKLTEIILSAERFTDKAADQKAAEQSAAERVARDTEGRPGSGLGPGPGLGLPPAPGLSPAPLVDLPPPPPEPIDPPSPDLDRSDRSSLLVVNERSRALVRGKPEEETDVVTAVRSARRWRRCAMLMTVIVVALGALLAAWRFIPNQLPSQLSPAALLNLHGPGYAKGSPSTLTPFDE